MIDKSVFNWIKLIQKSKELPYQAKYLAHYLSTFMNAHNDMAYPSQARIISETGMSQSTVNRYLAVLEEQGWIIRDKGNSRRTTRYTTDIPNSLMMRLSSEMDSVTQTLSSELDSVTQTHRQCHTDTKVVSHRHTNNKTITSNNKTVGSRTRSPSLDEVLEYCEIKQANPYEAVKFFDYYESINWMRGKTKITKWKSAFSGWMNRSKDYAKASNQKRTERDTLAELASF